MRSSWHWFQAILYAGMYCSLILSPLWILLAASGLLVVLLPFFAIAVVTLSALWFKPRVDALYDVDAVLKANCPSARGVLWQQGGLSQHFLSLFYSAAVACVLPGLGLLLLALDSRELVVALMGLLLIGLSAGMIWWTRHENTTPSLVALRAYVKSRGTDEVLLERAAGAIAQPMRDSEAARLTSASS